jgi:hypothetical protein
MHQISPVDQLWTAARLLRNNKLDALADGELMRRLDGLLTALGLELEADRESIPKSVRCAALKLAEHIARSSVPILYSRAGPIAPTVQANRSDQVSEVLTSPSRLTRMG